MLQKDKDRLGYAEGMSEEEAKKLQMDIYMQMYKSGNINKEIIQAATNLAKDATVRDKFGFGKNTMPEELKSKRIDNIADIMNSEPNPIRVNRDLIEFVVNQKIKEIEDDREQKAEGGSLKNPEKADLDKDGKISDYEQARGEAVEESMEEREGMQEGGMMNEQMEMLMGKNKEEPEMKPDEEMEDDYVDFVVNEALDEDEEDYLMKELQSNEKLSGIFDKVIEVASEFSGAGPVEGPGTEVSDSIPARLSDGEFVFTAKATAEIGADKLMSMMKEAEAAADERQGMQEGGVLSETTTTTRRFANPMQEDEEEVMQDEKTIQDMRGTNPRMQ